MVQFRDYELGLADFAVQMFNAGGGSAHIFKFVYNRFATLSPKMNTDTMFKSQYVQYGYIS